MKAQDHRIIEVNDLTKKFTTYKRIGIFKREKSEKEVVKHLSFNVKKGEIVGFLGPNGAGKSTTIKMLTGILTPTSGDCLVNGFSPIKNRKQNAYNLGVVFGQRTQLWWDLSVWDNLCLLKEIYRLTNEGFEKRYEYLNGILNLDEIKYSQIRSLSLGQRMKADIAGALLHSPKILFLDEPTIGLDVVIKDKILKSLKKINKDEGVTILLTTHDMRDVEYLCNRAIIINYGEIIYDDSLEKLKEYYGNDKLIKLTLRNVGDIKNTMETMKDLVKSYSIENNILKLTIKKDIQIEKKVLSKVFQAIDIDEIRFEEVNIDKIIKKIYEE
ncbi:ATP-binding cassette domain-containing protein [Sneathia vaginalis]|uniref:ABC transporter ATP-binding protein n=1 Tax=Sneathia TaxID=168808 RepID=UPI001868D933|nr:MULTISPECIES: ATP-binding cassette domain-containing protein [Sneathia]MBE3030887.1 ATP-binding cassette domain-containing protein [Sneathia sp. DSM 16631]MDK9581319.1 ATP-binding cassette domain-containing protein [Sneathia vaginalis]